MKQIKGSFYTLFFILLNVVYLVIELSFNARILDASAAFSPSTDFGQLEIYGRSISASGATLFAWRLFVPSRNGISFFRLWVKFFLIALIVFPLMFIGQKNLVDNLVNLSSSETRRTAEILNLLKFGVANGFVEIEELSVDELLLQSPEGKMFITVSGLLAYNSSNMRIVLERELKKIAGYAVQTQKSETSQRLYKSYLYASREIHKQFKNYQKLVDKLERSQAESYQVAIKMYRDAMNRALLQWQDYQQQLALSDGIDKVSKMQISSMQYLLLTGQQRSNRCTSRECYDNSLQKFQMRLAQQLGFYSSVSDWCQTDTEAGSGLLCLKDAAAIQRKILNLRYLTLAVNAGLTQVYLTKLAYLNSMDLRSTVFSSLKQQGIQVDAAWTFNQHEKMLLDISHQLDTRYFEQYDRAVFAQFDAHLKPRSELDEFSQIASMQNYFAQAFGEQYRQPVRLNLSLKEFEQNYFADIFLAKYNALLNKLQADESWYEDDGPYEVSGKTSLRNLVVPAVAISFSLIFGLLNAINLVLNLLFVLIEEKWWLRWSAFSVLFVLILLMPLRHDYRIYSQPAYVDLLSETEKNYGLWASALDWIAKTEPLVYPIGNILRYNLLDGFSFD